MQIDPLAVDLPPAGMREGPMLWRIRDELDGRSGVVALAISRVNDRAGSKLFDGPTETRELRCWHAEPAPLVVDLGLQIENLKQLDAVVFGKVGHDPGREIGKWSHDFTVASPTFPEQPIGRVEVRTWGYVLGCRRWLELVC